MKPIRLVHFEVRRFIPAIAILALIVAGGVYGSYRLGFRRGADQMLDLQRALRVAFEPQIRADRAEADYDLIILITANCATLLDEKGLAEAADYLDGVANGLRANPRRDFSQSYSAE